jgi:hypothetical protein
MTTYLHSRKEITNQLKNLISMEPTLIKGIVNDLLAKKPSAVKGKCEIERFMCETDGCQSIFKTYEQFEKHLLECHITPKKPKDKKEDAEMLAYYKSIKHLPALERHQLMSLKYGNGVCQASWDTPQPSSVEECEIAKCHIQWAGDGYYCSNCMTKYVSSPQSSSVEQKASCCVETCNYMVEKGTKHCHLHQYLEASSKPRIEPLDIMDLHKTDLHLALKINEICDLLNSEKK